MNLLNARTLFLQFFWMFGFVLLILFLVAFRGQEWISEKHRGYTLFYQNADQAVKANYVELIDSGYRGVTDFFGAPYKAEFNVYVFPSRAMMDAQWQKDWKMPDFKSECWMVASGVGARLDLLSFGKWAAEACEHDPSDKDETSRLIKHELVHVFHGQQNPSPDFSEVQGLDWFAEGIATYVSGQCTVKRIEQVKEIINQGKTPPGLDQFWTGPGRYGQSGTLVMYIDKKFGRDKLKKLMGFTTKPQALAELGITERDLIENWKQFTLALP